MCQSAGDRVSREKYREREEEGNRKAGQAGIISAVEIEGGELCTLRL